MRTSASCTRVLLVGPMPPTKGGVTTFMLNLMASPLAGQVEFVPFTTSRPPKRDVTRNWGYGAMLRGGPRRMAAGMVITLRHLAMFPMAALRADLVQVQASDYQVFWEAGAYALLARLLRRPVLLRIGGAFDMFHAGASRPERRLIAAVLRLPAVVVAQSAFAEGVIRKAGRTGEIVRLPNWSASLPPPPARDLAAVPTCLFIAGQEAERKGVEEVIAAMLALHAQGCRVRFHLLAAPPGLAARVAALGLPGVCVQGPAAHAEVLDAMRRCAVFLLPSHGEGFPNSLVEAMAAGMACIATPVGAVPEMAEGGGVLCVPVGDAAALAAAIARLAASAELRAALGKAAWRTVRDRYTAQAALPGLAGAYGRLIAARLERRPARLWETRRSGTPGC